MTIRLTQPTDFLILEALADGERDISPNIAQRIGRSREYVNTRVPVLADYNLLKRVGPVEGSGLYQITPLGVAAFEKQDLYDRDRTEFEEAIHESAEEVTITRPSVTYPP